MATVKQALFRSPIIDIRNAVETTLKKLNPKRPYNHGETVAVAVGSRGIDHIGTIVHETIRFLIQAGLKPFIVPAMGSHGGGTPEGQETVLRKFGISKTELSVPVISDMKVAHIRSLPEGADIYFSEAALSADHVVVINRVKPHTKFTSDIESGLCKMLAVGLGKNNGAVEIHRKAVQHSFGIIESAARYILEKCNVLFGLAIVEDGYGQPAQIEAISHESIISREKHLLKKAYEQLARIPLNHIDVLIIDQIGKDISGIGMDSNVTGRHRDITGDFTVSPFVKRIFIRELSPASDGNGIGIGLADVTTKRLVDALDRKKTYANAIAAISPEKAAIPLYVESDLQALEICISACGIKSNQEARIIRIKNTASLEYFKVSRAFEEDVNLNGRLSFVAPWGKMHFDDNGNLPVFDPTQP
ncbi:MAG: DUF362 domain-containing protein [Desulfobacterales bacterium]